MLSWARVLLLGPALLALSLVSFFSPFFFGGGESVADGVPGACGSGDRWEHAFVFSERRFILVNLSSPR